MNLTIHSTKSITKRLKTIDDFYVLEIIITDENGNHYEIDLFSDHSFNLNITRKIDDE